MPRPSLDFNINVGNYKVTITDGSIRRIDPSLMDQKTRRKYYSFINMTLMGATLSLINAQVAADFLTQGLEANTLSSYSFVTAHLLIGGSGFHSAMKAARKMEEIEINSFELTALGKKVITQPGFNPWTYDNK